MAGSGFVGDPAIPKVHSIFVRTNAPKLGPATCATEYVCGMFEHKTLGSGRETSNESHQLPPAGNEVPQSEHASRGVASFAAGPAKLTSTVASSKVGGAEAGGIGRRLNPPDSQPSYTPPL